MFCKNCGSQLPDDAAFCVKCGAPTGTTSAAIDSSFSVQKMKPISLSASSTNPDGISRPALLIYLQRIRDLEVAKATLKDQFDEEREEIEDEISYLESTFEVVDLPKEPDWDIGATLFGGVFIGFCAWLFLAFFCLFIKSNPLPLGLPSFLISMIIVFLSQRKTYQDEMKSYQQQCNDIAEENSANRIQDMEDQETAKALRKELSERTRTYNDEIGKIDSLLNEYYSINLIPSRFRNNMYYACYIYNMISTSTLSLHEVIFSTQIDDAVQQLITTIKQQTDRIISAIHSEGEQIRRQQAQHQERLESQNMQILEREAQIASNTADQAYYARIQANEQEYTNWLLATDMMGLWK